MKRITPLILAMIFPTLVMAMPAVTKKGYLACTSEQSLDDVIAFAAAGDTGSTQAYIQGKKCILVKAGLHVTVLKSPGFLGGRAQYSFQGLKLWTVREALNYSP